MCRLSSKEVGERAVSADESPVVQAGFKFRRGWREAATFNGVDIWDRRFGRTSEALAILTADSWLGNAREARQAYSAPPLFFHSTCQPMAAYARAASALFLYL